MKQNISLDLLTEQSVTVMTTRTFEDNGQEFTTPPHAKAYMNSKRGREEVTAEVPEPFAAAILAAWGDVANVQEIERETEFA